MTNNESPDVLQEEARGIIERMLNNTKRDEAVLRTPVVQRIMNTAMISLSQELISGVPLYDAIKAQLDCVFAFGYTLGHDHATAKQILTGKGVI